MPSDQGILDLGSSTFDVDAYMSKLLKEKTLDELVKEEEQMVNNVSCFTVLLIFVWERGKTVSMHGKKPHFHVGLFRYRYFLNKKNFENFSTRTKS